MKQFSKKNSTLLFILLTGILAVVAFISYNKILQFNKSVEAVMHTNMVKSKIVEVGSNIKDAETGQRGYLLTGDSVFLQPFLNAEQRSNRVFATLDSLLSDNAEQQEKLMKVKILVDKRYLLLNKSLKLSKNILPNPLLNVAMLNGKNTMVEVQTQITLMLHAEDELLLQRTQVKDRSATFTPVFLLIVSIFSIFAITVFFFRLQKETSQRISVSESNILLQEAKQQIEASEKRFKTLSETIPHMVWTATPDGSRNYFNKYFLDYTGLTFDELKGDRWQSIIFPEDIEIELAHWHYAIKAGENYKIEKRIRHQDGTYRWHLSQGIAQKNNEGAIVGWIGTNTDITEQKSFTEELERRVKERTSELKERSNLVEAILESSKDYIAVYDKDNKLITINRAAEVLMGWKRADVLGKTLLELLPESKGSKEESDLKSALKGNNIYNEAYQSTLTSRYIVNYLKPLKDFEGNVYAAVVMANDVTNIIEKQIEIETARKLLQLRNQTFELAENIAKLGSYKWNTTTGTMEYSDNLFRLIDCEPQEFVPSIEKFLSFVHPDDLQQVISNGEQTRQTGELVETPYRIISKIGIIKYFRSSGNFSGEGDNQLLIGTVQDISREVVASKVLRAKNLELENANAELASFSYVASHDLQEPLRKIQGFSKRILDKDADVLSDSAKDYFNRIRGAAQRMQNLIESLMSFSRNNLSEVIFEKTDLNQILIEVLRILDEAITKKNAVIESQTLPILTAVPIQMHQLFLNLIGNALKYSKPDVAPIVKITAEKVTTNEIAGPVKQNDVFWKITISDNGIGFEQQYEHKIFELFQRLHGKTVYEGTGIGLALCKKIVLTHNGTILATGQPGIGSTFTFFLSDDNKS